MSAISNDEIMLALAQIKYVFIHPEVLLMQCTGFETDHLSNDAVLAIAKFGSIENQICLLQSDECMAEAVHLIIHGVDTSRPLTLLPLLYLPPQYLEPGDWGFLEYLLTPTNLISLYSLLKHLQGRNKSLHLADLGLSESYALPRLLAALLAEAQFSDFTAFYNFVYNPQQFHCSNQVRSMLRLAVGVGLALNPHVSLIFLFELAKMGRYFKLAADLNPQMGTDAKRLQRLFEVFAVDEFKAPSSYVAQIKFHPYLPYRTMLQRLFTHPNLPLELLIQETMSKNKELADLARAALENSQEGGAA